MSFSRRNLQISTVLISSKIMNHEDSQKRRCVPSLSWTKKSINDNQEMKNSNYARNIPFISNYFPLKYNNNINIEQCIKYYIQHNLKENCVQIILCGLRSIQEIENNLKNLNIKLNKNDHQALT